MLESEAKTLFCPYTFGGDVRRTPQNMCVGSKCMAWHVERDFVGEEVRNPIAYEPVDPPAGICRMMGRR